MKTICEGIINKPMLKTDIYVLKEEYNTFRDIEERFKEVFPEIYESMTNENFNMDFPCNIISEIKSKGKLMGFCFYSNSIFTYPDVTFVLESYYLLPEYNKLFYVLNDYVFIGEVLDFKTMVKNPKRELIMEMLEIKEAERIGDNLVKLRTPILCEPICIGESLFIRENLNEINRNLTETNLYDTELCSAIGIPEEPKEVFESREDFETLKYGFLSLIWEEDEEQYDCINNRRNNERLGDGSYFYHAKQILDKYEEESDSKKDDDKDSKAVEQILEIIKNSVLDSSSKEKKKPSKKNKNKK